MCTSAVVGQGRDGGRDGGRYGEMERERGVSEHVWDQAYVCGAKHSVAGAT